MSTQKSISDQLVKSTEDLDINERGVFKSDAVSEVVDAAKTRCKRVEECVLLVKQLQRQLDGHYKKLEPLFKDIGPLLSQLEDLWLLDNLLKRLENLKLIHEILETNCNENKDKDGDNRVLIIVNTFKSLINEYEFVKNRTPVMKKYVEEIMCFWNKILLEKFENKFVQTFGQINWPSGITSGTELKQPVSSEGFNNFLLYFNALLGIDIEGMLSDNQPDMCLPLQLMVSPLKKRFQFHFMELKSKVNRPEKPEWYLSQVLTWIRANQEFLSKNVDPLLSAHFSGRFISAKIQLIQALLECVATKLKNDLPMLVYDDKLFSHLVDEILFFNRELLKLEPRIKHLEYRCDLLKILTAEPFFTRILNLERKKATEFIDSALESSTAWTIMIGSDDQIKVPECADNFLIMLQAISDRCLMFGDTSSRYSFVKLQLDLLDDFRLRLTQLLHSQEFYSNWPLPQRHFAIINAVNYLIIVLNEWENLPFFIDLEQVYSPNEGLFQGIISLFEHWLNELLNQVIKLFMNQVRAKLKTYADNRWFCMKESAKEVSGSACELLHFMASNLVLLQNAVAGVLFERLLKEIVQEINLVLLEDVVLQNSFNQAAAVQLNYDLTTGFISVFRAYIRRPEVYFVEIREACKLLNLQRGTALLLEEAINRKDADKKSVLKEMEIESLSTEMVLDVLHRRIFVD